MKQSPMSGGKLILLSAGCAVTPFIFELIADGGPSNFGAPETGYAALMTGFFLWPTALILFLIGIKRVFFNYDPTVDDKPQVPVPLPTDLPKPQVWNMEQDDQQKPAQ